MKNQFLRLLLGDTDVQAAVADAADGGVSPARQIDASSITSGIFSPERLGVGTPSSDRFLRGDGQWAAPPSAASATAEVPLDERIKIAIRALPEDGYGSNGKPNVAAIEAALGESITAADRDRVWAEMQEESE